MMNLKIFILLTILFSSVCLGQNKKIYYDSDYKVCKKSKAEFYRIIPNEFDNQSLIKIKSFYISGELRSEENLRYIHEKDYKLDIRDGLYTRYYKNGNKEFEVVFVNGKKEGLQTAWYETGELQAETYNKNDLVDGTRTYYYKSGKIKMIIPFKNGKLSSKYILNCNEFSECENLFNNNLYTNDYQNIEEWKVENNDFFKTSLINNKGLLIESFDIGSGIHNQTINLPLDLINNFTITATLNNLSEIKSEIGLVWGYKDYENYNYFHISPNGLFKIGHKYNGIDLLINSGYFRKPSANSISNLKIFRVSKKIFFAVNNDVVFSKDFAPFSGNKIGFSLSSNQKVLVTYFEVKQNNNDLISDETSWKSNGSGFFIDKTGYLVTNYHVIKEGKVFEIDVTNNGQTKSYEAKLISTDKKNDLAILKIISADFKPLESLNYYFSTKTKDVGASVFALGYPLTQLMGNEVKFTDGKISSKSGFQGDITTYQISVPIQPGNSGGPLFDEKGNLVGITSSGINKQLANNANYAIKTSYLKLLIESISDKIELPDSSIIKDNTLTEQIKILSDYVVLIKVK